MPSSYRIELNKWLSQLDVEANRVLDIGGSQLPIKGRVKLFAVDEYIIADLPVPHAESPKPDIEIDLNLPAHNMPQQYFDLIFCLEVFDYIYDPKTAFQTIASCLEPKGTAWITFPSVYPLHQPIEDDALRYMPGGIKKLAQACGLEIVKMLPRRPETNKWQEFFYAERMRGAKHQDHNFTGWIVELRK